VIYQPLQKPVPHHTTVRQWVLRNGYHNLHSKLENADDWIALGDVTYDIGKTKCLAILGVRMHRLEWRRSHTLTHKDVSLLGLYPTEKSTGEFICKAFEEACERIGGNFLAIVTDQGSDMKKGARLFVEQHLNTKIIYDIPHKLSLVVEWTLKDDPEWLRFTKKLLETRRHLQQTELAGIMPATQRTKARFMDISYLVEWPKRILKYKEEGRLKSITDQRYDKYFGWIKEFEASLEAWEYMVGTVDFMRSILGEYGLSYETQGYIKAFIDEIYPREDKQLEVFTAKALNAINEECNKVAEEELLICSTEVLESVFGKFKEINAGNQGITGNVLGISAFVGAERTEQAVKQVMENSQVKMTVDWIKQKMGDTIGRIRHRFFVRQKGQNLT